MTASLPLTPRPEILRDIVDSHAHPTDYKQFRHDPAYRRLVADVPLHKVCTMSSHLGDQDLVKQLADEHPDKIVPAFGLHPWWSHHISFNADGKPPSKRDHYAQLFPSYFSNEDGPDEALALYDSLPEPTLMSTYLRDVLRPLLTRYPNAMLGEVGLDRSFRIPFPATDAKSDRSDYKQAKRFTNLKVPMEHQLKLLNTQLEVAFELDRNVSFHDVQAHGAVMDLLASLAKTSDKWKHSRSKICLHSFGGSVDVIERISKHIDKTRIYFSFSTTINARLERLEELIRAVPDDRLLIESDYNHISMNATRVWEILGNVCHAKGWLAEEAAGTLKRNWQEFAGSGLDQTGDSRHNIQ